MTSADQGSEQTAVNKDHADALRHMRRFSLAPSRYAPTAADGCDVLGAYADAIDAAIAVLDPLPARFACDDCALGRDCDKHDRATTERERCVFYALEITQIKQHHGVAEIADVIQRAREELLAENERPVARCLKYESRPEAAGVSERLQVKLTAISEAARAEVERYEDALKGEP